jgi:hypothetical protein
MTIELPIPVSWRYLNLQIKTSGDLITSTESFSQIGSLTLSNKTLLNLVKIPLYLLFSDNQQDSIKNSIQRIAFKQGLIHVQTDPFIDMKYLSYIFKNKAKQALEFASSNTYATLNPKVQFYYRHLKQTVSDLTSVNNPTMSLQSITTLLFKEVNNQSAPSYSAIRENEAAIIALALFVGDYHLQTFLKSTLQMKHLKTSHKLSITLHRRKDLVLHFMYSAIIKIFANSSISLSIGEIKEISDSAKGGSGFSFADILADRAGTQFANNALGSNLSAKHLQKKLSLSNFEHDFFPNITGLPEGLTAKEFNMTYGDQNSKRYKQIIKEIDSRINHLAIYN